MSVFARSWFQKFCECESNAVTKEIPLTLNLRRNNKAIPPHPNPSPQRRGERLRRWSGSAVPCAKLGSGKITPTALPNGEGI